MQVAPAQFIDELQAVHVRHLQVGDDEMESAVAQLLQGLPRVAGHVRVRESRLHEQAARVLAAQGMVVQDEYFEWGQHGFRSCLA